MLTSPKSDNLVGAAQKPVGRGERGKIEAVKKILRGHQFSGTWSDDDIVVVLRETHHNEVTAAKRILEGKIPTQLL